MKVEARVLILRVRVVFCVAFALVASVAFARVAFARVSFARVAFARVAFAQGAIFSGYKELSAQKYAAEAE